MPEEKRLITVEDLNKIKYILDPQISPDGKWIAYVLQTPNPSKRSYDRNLFMISTTGGSPIQLTRSNKDGNPRWSPDGTRLAFISSRADKPQIYILPMTVAGEARALTSHENGAFAPEWSPDGERIAYLSTSNQEERDKEDKGEKPTPPKDELDGKHRKERQQEDEKMRWDPRPMERIPYRQGQSFMDDRHSQIYIIRTAEGLEGDDAKPKRMTNIAASYSEPVWSKSGRTIVTTRTWDIECDESFRFKNIYLIDVESGIERRFKDDFWNYSAPIPSYDGDWIVCSRSPSGDTDALTHLALIPLEGSGEAYDLNIELDRTAYFYDWLENGNIMVAIGTEGHVQFHELDPKTKQYTPVITDNQGIFEANIDENGSIAFVAATTNTLDELFFKGAGRPKQLTEINKAFLDEVRVLETNEVIYTTPTGQQVQGWYILPPDYEAGKKYPLALHIHGGPHVMWMPTAHAMWHEWQATAAEGYVVFFCNPRGSDGYGERFQQAIHNNWGDVTTEDVMAGVDLMISKGFVDESRMGITGGSFGGYMTAWIVGHTDRFASAVAVRGVYNISSFYGTSDVPVLMSSEFDSEPWENPEHFWKHSPLAYAQNIKTPLLIIHSENDFRVPIEQGEQLFAWVRRATKTPVKMIRFPREGHELTRSGEPPHRIRHMRETLDWFNAYCQPEKLEKPVLEEALEVED
jgi:dipeptidyl aminopeptidase/acylaminoacyl peptidase